MGAERVKCSKTFFEVSERTNTQNTAISGLYTDDNKYSSMIINILYDNKYSSSPKDILKFAKKIIKSVTPWRQLLKLLLLKGRKYS